MTSSCRVLVRDGRLFRNFAGKQMFHFSVRRDLPCLSTWEGWHIAMEVPLEVTSGDLLEPGQSPLL